MLRVGLFGVGMMGRHHARVLKGLDGVDLVGVVDPAGDEHGVAGDLLVDGFDRLLDKDLDYAVVASPTRTHLSLGMKLAAARVPTLIEKPLANTPEDAEELMMAFSAARTLGAVGHVERYNPAAKRAWSMAGNLGEILQVSTRRQGPPPGRELGTGVIMDLATHDIDLTMWITGQHYHSLDAQVAPLRGSFEDLVAATGVLTGGTVVNHLVNWCSSARERVVTLLGEKGVVEFNTHTRVCWWAPMDGPSESSGPIADTEPLVLEHEAFRDAVLGADLTGIVPLPQGLRVIRVADEMRRSGLGKVVVPSLR